MRKNNLTLLVVQVFAFSTLLIAALPARADEHCVECVSTAPAEKAECSCAKCEMNNSECVQCEECVEGGKEMAHKTDVKLGPGVDIDTPALEALLRSRVPIVVLDARYGQYDDGRRIPSAHQMKPDVSEDDAARVIPDKNSLIVTYCSNPQCPASDQLAERLRELGYSNVLHYPKGIEGWAESGNEIERAE